MWWMFTLNMHGLNLYYMRWMFTLNIHGLNAFIEIINKSNRKLNKLRDNQGRQFYSKLMQEGLDNNDVLMYSTLNESKLVIAEKFLKKI